MKNTNKWIIAVVVLIVIIGGVYFVKNKSSNNLTNSETIKIGVIAPLSGIFAKAGEDIKAGLESINHDGVEYVFEDEKCENVPTLSAFKKLTEVDKVNVILGPACGSPQEVITPLLKDKKVITIVPSAASIKLYEESGSNLYNIQYALEDESKYIADEMYKSGYKKVVIFSYRNAFSQTHHDSFIKDFKGAVVDDIIFLKDDIDVATEISKLKGLDFDSIFVTDGAFYFGQGIAKLKRFGITQPVYSMYVTEFPGVRELAEGVIYSFPKHTDNEKGITFELARQMGEFIVPIIKKCSGDYSCIKKSVDNSGEFDNRGIKIRDMIMKKIENGKPVEVK